MLPAVYDTIAAENTDETRARLALLRRTTDSSVLVLRAWTIDWTIRSSDEPTILVSEYELAQDVEALFVRRRGRRRRRRRRRPLGPAPTSPE